ncbi:hypothetical protein KFE69_03585 [bacterium SCSIO 12844]|nr:hypothetical protein KFE69_03585 [bacterium SCSIO 12844]
MPGKNSNYLSKNNKTKNRLAIVNEGNAKIHRHLNKLYQLNKVEGFGGEKKHIMMII